MKKILAIVTVFSILAINGFMLMEGGMASAEVVTVTSTDHTTGDTNQIEIDYNVELTVDPEMSLSCETSTVGMLDNINGMTGGTATGSRSCTAITNNFDGYTMQAAVTSMKHTEDTVSFSPASGATWPVIGADASGFGFYPSGDDAVSDAYLPSGAAAASIATSATYTALTGTATTVNYQAEVGAGSIMPSGLYQATSTISMYMN
jgi:hypothetical protein